MFTEFLSTYAMDLLAVLLAALLGGLGIAVKRILAMYVNTDVKRAVARTAMMAVEQLYKDIHGPAKLDQALKYAAQLLADYSITMSAQEMKLLIEEAVAEFNARLQ